MLVESHHHTYITSYTVIQSCSTIHSYIQTYIIHRVILLCILLHTCFVWAADRHWWSGPKSATSWLGSAFSKLQGAAISFFKGGDKTGTSNASFASLIVSTCFLKEQSRRGVKSQVKRIFCNCVLYSDPDILSIHVPCQWSKLQFDKILSSFSKQLRL